MTDLIDTEAITAFDDDTHKFPDDISAQAWLMRHHAYAPYSNYKVGCVVRTIDHQFHGANIENSSFGLTICAERVAISRAMMVLSSGRLDIDEICFATDTPGKHFAPCGACLQFIQEFARPDTKISHYNGETKMTWKFEDCLPNSAKVDVLVPDVTTLLQTTT